MAFHETSHAVTAQTLQRDKTQASKSPGKPRQHTGDKPKHKKTTTHKQTSKPQASQSHRKEQDRQGEPRAKENITKLTKVN